jgi:hypothetical protein
MNETQCLRSLYWIRMGQGLLLLVLLASCQGCGGESPKTGSSVVTGMTATLTWAAPTTNVDGTELTGLARYTIYYGQSSHHYTETITLPITSTLCQRKGDVEVCSYTISGLGEGVYYFAVTASNAAGKESGYSNEVSKKMD